MGPLIPYTAPLEIPLFGDVTLKGHGLLVVLGLVLGALLAGRKARRDGLVPGVVYRLVVWLVVGIAVGGHLGYLLFYAPGTLLSDPAALLRLTDGQSSFGGFFACALLAWWHFRRERRRLEHAPEHAARPFDAWAYADAALFGVLLGWCLGRIGCFTVHDHPGVETTFWLGVRGICPGGGPDAACHDLGLYEALWTAAVLGVFLVLDRRPRVPGFYVGLVCVLYAPSRFLADFLRHPLADTRYGGLTPAQYACAVLLVFGAWVLLRGRRNVAVADASVARGAR